MATNSTRKPEPRKSQAGDWQVRDKNAKNGVRYHEPIEGTVVGLDSKNWTDVPENIARKFLVDPAFEVRNEDGQPVASMPDQAKERETSGNFRLSDDEVIARLDELNRDALMARAARIPGGEKFNRNTKRETLIEWLKGVTKPARASDALADDDVEGMAPDEAAAAMGGGDGVNLEGE
jgi:hypothetical protein